MGSKSKSEKAAAKAAAKAFKEAEREVVRARRAEANPARGRWWGWR